MKKISVIMACKNSSKTIKDSIVSFLNQKYLNKELLIIDGGSIDQTIEIVKEFNHKDIHVNQINNLGLYASINYGIKKSTGDIIGLLHSDDTYFSDNALENIAISFNSYDVDAVYSDIVFVNNEYKVIRKWICDNIDSESASNGLLPPHTGLYLNRKVFKILGYYNEKYKISSDIEFMYKLFIEKRLKKFHLKSYTLNMQIGGLSTKSPLSIVKANIEVYKILKKLGVKFPMIMIFKKLIIKIKQYFL